MEQQRYIAFIRNIMIGREGMDRLRLLAEFERLGAKHPRSYISTGNFGFSLDKNTLQIFVNQLEAVIAGILERHEHVYVRSLDHLQQLRAENLFDSYMSSDTDSRLVTFSKEEIVFEVDLPFDTTRGDMTIFRCDGYEVFSIAREVNGRSTSPGRIIENMTNTKVTTRSWSTIEKILDKEVN